MATQLQRAKLKTAVALILATVVGCQKANPVVGKWKLAQSFAGVTVIREFRPDGTESMKSPEGSVDNELTYSVAGNQLTESVTSMTMGGQTIKPDPSKVPPGQPKSVTETFTLNGDKLAITNSVSGAPQTQNYDRVPN